ncbi:MAG: ATP-binding protein [Chloroflexota bacterium]|nr:ATP-binding protein [Chloroflexota bacterium]
MEKVGEILKEIDADISEALTPTTSSTDLPERSGDEVCPLCGGKGYVRRDVPVDHPDFGRLFPCKCRLAQLEAQRSSNLRNLGNLDHLARMTFETFVPEGYGLPPHKRQNLRDAYRRARQFVEDPEGWLVITGGYGCGKTHLAAAIANYRISQGLPALFVVVPDLLDHLRSTWSPANPVSFDERFEDVRTAPLLILDDLGTQNRTPWAKEKLFQIFNHRYNAQLPTVVTTNHELEEIDLRLRSRLVDPDLTEIITILAPDFRGRGMSRDQSDISSLSLHSDQTFDSFDQRTYELPGEEGDNLRRAFQIAQQYAESPEGWLVFTGTYGCGKTHLAAAIANHQVSQGYPALFVVVPDLLDHLRSTFSPQSPISYDKRFEEVRTVPLLILDDLGTQSATPWAKEKLFQIFNHRYNAQLPTVITTADKVEDIDPRLRTRILDSSRCTLFAIIAPAYYAS